MMRESRQRIYDERLCFPVQTCCNLVEEDNGAVLEKRACKTKAVTLAC